MQTSHRKLGTFVPNIYFPNGMPATPGPSHPVTPGHTTRTCGAPTLHTTSYTHGLARAAARTPGSLGGRSRPGSRQARTRPRHTCREYGPRLARALAPALTPPRFPSSLVFLETLYSPSLPLGRKCSLYF